MENKESLFERIDGSLWVRIPIPSNNEFVEQHHDWIYGKVSKHFIRNKERIQDTVQNVRVRLLQKDFIARWFFKHLSEELVDRDEADRILGNDKLKFISVVQPVVGNRSEPDSLWKVSRLLEYAKFDHERYFYSIQGHTIDSDSMLKLLGYSPGSYNVLKSLYTQGRMKPSELTREHRCVESIEHTKTLDGKCSIPGCDKKHFSRGFCTTHYGRNRPRCPICDRGRAVLKAHGVSLADDWTKSSYAASLRWDDTQARPFLRQWKKMNLVSSIPHYIVRPHKYEEHCQYKGIKAGLMKYANKIIDNEVINNFGRMTRTLDAPRIMSPDTRDSDIIAWELDDDGMRDHVVFKDTSSTKVFEDTDNGMDILTLIRDANLTDEEQSIILEIDLMEANVKEYAESIGKTVAHIHRVRSTALDKMRYASNFI